MKGINVNFRARKDDSQEIKFYKGSSCQRIGRDQWLKKKKLIPK